MARYDTIIKGGTVFDGRGNPPIKADVGISKDEIKGIGDLNESDGDEIVYAENKYVCPGFIDITSHSDTRWTLFTQPNQESLIKQGITTMVGGNCGFSIAPIISGAGIKSLSRWTDISKINTNWKTVKEFLKELETYKLALNFGTLVGFNTLLYEVVGEEAKSPSKDEIRQMKALLESSLKDGAFGISTNLGLGHKDIFRDKDLVEIFGIAGKFGGVTKHHLEDEGKGILPAVSRLINISRKTGVSLIVSHLKILGRGSWDYFKGVMEIMDNAIKEGLNISYDFFPYDRTGSNLFALLPPWLKREKSETIMQVLSSRDDQRRKDALEYIRGLTLHYEKITISSSQFDTKNVGKTLAEISRSFEVPPEEVILDLLLVNNLNISMFSEVINFDHVLEIAKKKYSMLSSDGAGYDYSLLVLSFLPHPRSFGSFPRALRIFAKETGILSWEEAIHKMTGMPAGAVGIKDRGTIEKGKKADIIVFDPQTILDKSTYDSPFKFPEGIAFVFINGSAAFADGELTGSFPGKIIKRK